MKFLFQQKTILPIKLLEMLLIVKIKTQINLENLQPISILEVYLK